MPRKGIALSEDAESIVQAAKLELLPLPERLERIAEVLRIWGSRLPSPGEHYAWEADLWFDWIRGMSRGGVFTQDTPSLIKIIEVLIKTAEEIRARPKTGVERYIRFKKVQAPATIKSNGKEVTPVVPKETVDGVIQAFATIVHLLAPSLEIIEEDDFDFHEREGWEKS